MTTSSAVVSFKQIFQAGMGYVAVSRVTSLSGLHIIDMDESKLPPTYNVKPFLDNLTALLEYLEMVDIHPIIVCGDFNENLLYYGKSQSWMYLRLKQDQSCKSCSNTVSANCTAFKITEQQNSTTACECHPSGCLTDLFIQMFIIMLLKQTFNTLSEYLGPKGKMCINNLIVDEKDNRVGIEMETDKKVPQYILSNYNLTKTDDFSLFDEFMEMVMQFSFTTIFVAAFPLAPLLALFNNILEIRGDAIKMVSLEQRLVPRKTNNIGVWTQVLETVGALAVLANGLVIGVTSDFIPRLVYRYRTGPCATGIETTKLNNFPRHPWTHAAAPHLRTSDVDEDDDGVDEDDDDQDVDDDENDDAVDKDGSDDVDDDEGVDDDEDVDENDDDGC
ncbi:hypothetical protein WMY93_014446 [Mugilogobius chulae]|uniref:Anoctamin n=1 Tax=Mugilogobius chulae TaxID=88201 RepID=A0AAW0P655_9GOBI